MGTETGLGMCERIARVVEATTGIWFMPEAIWHHDPHGELFMVYLWGAQAAMVENHSLMGTDPISRRWLDEAGDTPEAREHLANGYAQELSSSVASALHGRAQ